MAHFESTQSTLYMKYNGFDAKLSKQEKMQLSSMGIPEEHFPDYVPLHLDGTTFSGLSFRTTLGNTLNSILQTFYYIEQAGIRNPWASDKVKLMVSGDDVVVLCHPSVSRRI